MKPSEKIFFIGIQKGGSGYTASAAAEALVRKAQECCDAIIQYLDEQAEEKEEVCPCYAYMDVERHLEKDCPKHKRSTPKSECHCGKDGHALNSINCPVHGQFHVLGFDELESVMKVNMSSLDGLIEKLAKKHSAAVDCLVCKFMKETGALAGDIVIEQRMTSTGFLISVKKKPL